MILVAGPSPSYQRVWTLSRLKVDRVNRAKRIEVLPSGKGINCARAARRIGAKAEVLTFLGGDTGRWMQEQLREERVTAHVIEVAGPTRTCNTVVDERSGEVTELVEESFPLTSADEERYRARFNELLPVTELLVCIGSVPAGISPTLYRDLIHLASKSGIPSILDAQGEALIAAMESRPVAVKINHRELRGTLRKKLAPAEGIKEMLRRGCGSVLVTHGADPAWLGSGERISQLSLPGVVGGNATGSGDSVCAGLAMGLLSKRTMEESVRYALGCGMANVGFGYGRLDEVSVRKWTQKIEDTPFI